MAQVGEYLVYGKGEHARVVRIDSLTPTHASCRDKAGSAVVLDLNDVDGVPRKQKAMRRLKAPKGPPGKAWPKP